MKTSVFTLLILTGFCLMSCTVHDMRQNVETIYISQETLSNHPERSPTDSIITIPSDSLSLVYVVNDNLCIIKLKNKWRPMSIEIRNLNNNDPMYCFDTKEEGLLMPIVTRSWNYFTINDELTQRTICINIDEALKSNIYTPESRHSNLSSERIIPIGKKQAFLNPNSYEEKSQRVLFSDDDWNYRTKRKTKYISGNVIHGEIIKRCDNSAFAYVPDNDNNIELIDKNGRKYKNILLQHERKQEIRSKIVSGTRMYYFKAPLVDCFSTACAGRESLLAGFIDDNGNNMIITLDWTGNLIDAFYVDGDILELSYSSDEKVIYSWERRGLYDTLYSYQSN